MTRGSVSLSCATTQTLPAFLNSQGSISVYVYMIAFLRFIHAMLMISA